jgi:hypothetical protein
MRAEQTELMVLVTPRLVRALDPDEVPTLPVRPGAFVNPADDEDESVPAGDGASEAEPVLRDAPPPARRGTAPPPPGTVRRPPGPRY